MKNQPITKIFQKHGIKLTKSRKKLAGIFEREHMPLSEVDLRTQLKVNKTTVYRSLQLFAKLGIIKEIDFGDGKKRYEVNFHNHHHHLVCTNCDSVQDIFVHNDVKHMEDKIRKQKNFKIQTHNLEFFGLCKNCTNN